MIEEPKSGVTYTIGGVKVEFPMKAYPSQISMMDKVIRGCHRAQNCLLESPTGSGKTLALLCGAVAWQKAEARRLRDLAAVEHQELLQKISEFRKLHLEEMHRTVTELKEEYSYSVENDRTCIMLDNDAEESDVFRPCFKKQKIDSASDSDSTAEVMLKSSVNLTNDKSADDRLPVSTSDFLSDIPLPKPKQIKIPKIYFSTRTHKQVTQVINELRRTTYNDIKTCVLSSRNHSCIYENVAKFNMTKNDLCHELLDPRAGSGCAYYNNVKKYNHSGLLRSQNFPSVWDLEDLISFGKKKTVCPYYTARELMISSDVIICPYNYIIDPLIRQSMNISLNGNILILDEAHNIEDTCREAASLSLHQDSIFDAIRDCEETLNHVENKIPYAKLIQILSSVSNWIDHHKNEITDLSDYDQGKLMIFGVQAAESFKDYEFGPGVKFEEFKEIFNEILMKKQQNEDADKNNYIGEDNNADATISGATKSVIEGLILVLDFLYDAKYTYDYHVVVTKSFQHRVFENPKTDGDGWFSSRKMKPKQITQWRYTLHFWCLNPATTFNEIKDKARSIILTSGTLSPMNSFQSELGAMFPITLEANHVIDPSQCWIGSIGRGPNNICLDGKYANTNTYQFQDEIGVILSEICSFVPNGILCFVPSYTLLEKLHERWSCTGILGKINKHKVVICEPRRSDEFDLSMKQFYLTIEKSSTTSIGEGITGALFIAVCRGKISEGLDFADKNARVVITIGIPFPNIKDSQITLKKKYNDQHQYSKGLLGGNDWYQIQAYRALNQALGRCIRHREDWGAILLIDDRFSNDHYYKSLSKWVRNKICHHTRYNQMVNHLSAFIQNRLRIDSKNI